MSSPALILLIVSMLTLWGGLALSIFNLIKHPDQSQD